MENMNKTLFKDSELTEAIQQSLLEAVSALGISSLTEVDEENKEKILQLGYEIINNYEFEIHDNPRCINGQWIKTTKRIIFSRLTNNPQPYIAYCRLVDFSKLPRKNPFNHKPNRNKFIKSLKKIYPNVDAYNVGTALTVWRKVIQNIYYNLGVEGLRPQQISMWQYSAIGGTGKSEVLERLRNFAKSKGITVADVCPTNLRWSGSEYSSSLIGLSQETFPPTSRNDNENTIIKLNNIIDNGKFEVEYKCKDSYYLPSVITLFMNSNKLPFDTNTRRYGVIRFNETPYSKIPVETKEKYFQKRTTEEWNEIFLDLFESCPFDEEFEDEGQCKNSASFNELIYAAQDIVKDLNTCYSMDVNPQDMTIREFTITYLRAIGKDYQPETRKKYQYMFTQDILKACAEGVIQPSHRVNGNLVYSRYNIEEIAALPTSETSIPNSLDDIDNMWERTAVAFDKFLIDDKPTDPKPEKDKDEVEDETEVVDFSSEEFTSEDMKLTHMNAYDDVTSKPVIDIKDTTQYILTAEPTEEYIQSKPAQIDRKGEHYRPVCFLYESDELPIEEQEKMALQLKDKIPDNIFSITHSGSKSIHTLVWIKPEDRDEVRKDFKWYWTEVAKKLFGDNWKHLDKNVASIARLSRRPGAIRDNGNKQTCLYINRNVKGLDIDNLIQAKKVLDKEEEMRNKMNAKIREMKKTSSSYNERPLMEQFKSIANKSSSESVRLAYDILNSGSAESGSNMIGAIMALAKMAEGDSKWIDLRDELYDICHKQHPTNIPTKPF